MTRRRVSVGRIDRVYGLRATWTEPAPETGLAVATFELAHEGDQVVDALLRERVVDRCPHPADGAMTLEPVEAGGRGLLHERLLEVFVGQTERDVHQAPAVGVGRGSPEARAV